jgi:alpha-glucosidase
MHVYSADRPEVHDVIAEMRRVSNEFPARVLIGEIYLPVERLVAYYGKDLSGAHLPFNFALISAPWHARYIEQLIEKYESVLPPGAWPNWVLGNHDKPRLASRIGDDQARVAAMLLLTLRGTPTLYYGDELGMRQVPIAPEDVRDPFEKNVPGLGVGRDGCRTPMQWDASKHAGFSTARPWLPLASDAVRDNVASLDADAKSILSLYRMLIALRKRRPELARGSYEPIAAQNDLLVYRRTANGRSTTVALNLGAEPVSVAVASLGNGKVLLSTFLDRSDEAIDGDVGLRGNEGIVVGEDHAG